MCPSRARLPGIKRWRHSGDHSIAIRAPKRLGEYHLAHRSPAGCQAGSVAATVYMSACCRPGPAATAARFERRSVAQSPSAERKCVSDMTYRKHSWVGAAWLKLATIAALVAAAGCADGEGLSPSEEVPATAAPAAADSVPVDSAAVPLDSTLVPVDTTGSVPDSAGITTVSTLAAGTQPGIVFGSYGMMPASLTSVHTGTLLGGDVDENNIMSVLAGIRAKGGRIVLKMCRGQDKYVKNADGTFSLTKWKLLVDRFKKVDLTPYINDGTILAHFLIDEPHRTAKWGGKIISQATIEAMAQYSKQIWPNLTTAVRVVPSWLASAPVVYRSLDAGWLQYAYGKGDPARLVASEITVAKNKGLGLLVGLNVLDGGNGSSGIRGWTSGRWAMSAAEIRNYGNALVNQSYACGFYNWTYQYHGPTYYGRSDIKSAMAELSQKAKAHVRTSCRQ